jgi:hypothetical protein
MTKKTKKTKNTPPQTLKEAFKIIGGRSGYAMLLRQCGLKAYSALIANWERTNSIPPQWGPALMLVEDRFGKNLPALSHIKSYVRIKSREDFNLASNSYADNKLYQQMKVLYGSVDKFIKHMKTEHGAKIQRNQVYDWFKRGTVSAQYQRLMLADGFSRQAVGLPPQFPKGSLIQVSDEINAEDLF